MAKKKFYSVRKGRTTGIFTSWNECKRSITGFSSAQYKSFETLEEAEAFLNASSAAPIAGTIPPPDTILAYVDGSYQHSSKRYSFGCVLIAPDGSKAEKNGVGDNPAAAENRNVAGELLGAMYAVKWAHNNGYNNIVIRHDYEGIAKWFTGEWQAKSFCACNYLSFMKNYRDNMNIRFEKVRAHSGESINELVDKLAKKALE